MTHNRDAPNRYRQTPRGRDARTLSGVPQGVEMVPLEEGSLLTDVSRVSDEDIHFVETADGGLVCPNSLLNKISWETEDSTLTAQTHCHCQPQT